MQPLLARLTDAEPDFHALPFERVIGGHGPRGRPRTSW
jgi:hypothetical protein